MKRHPIMGSSLCPHLVQEYFQRVSDILTVYRPQILKQVEYDKISENLVLRGAIRQEEHQRIFLCEDLEGQVSQMLVVIQNRMWGLENLLAAFMDEHVSSWLTQELFRAYMEHLVGPLRKLKENPLCQCVQIPNSMLYRGWVKALKSLDALILKTGTALGFMKQTMYPTDNMLTFLSEKLAEYTGGDSASSIPACQTDELVPYGFAPNASGEVQVAELEDDDIHDLFSLSETLCIGYHNNSSDETAKETAAEDDDDISNKTSTTKAYVTKDSSTGTASVGKPVQRKSVNKRKGNNSQTSPSLDARRQRTISEQETTDSEHQKQSSDSINQDKLAKQRDLIARLAAPKSSSSSVRSRNAPNRSADTKQRPRSAEIHRSFSVPSSSSPTTSSPSSASSNNTRDSNKTTADSTPGEKKQVKSGKTQGFVRSKSMAPTSPKSKTRRLSPKANRPRPTAVAKPTPKDSSRKGNSLNKQNSIDEEGKEQEEVSCNPKSEDHLEDDDILSKNTKLFNDEHANSSDDEDYGEMLPEMSSLLLSNTILADGQDKTKSLAYYQLNFDSFSDDNE